VPALPAPERVLVRNLRLILVGLKFQVKMLSRSSFNGILGILYPLFFATVAFFMFRAGAKNALPFAALGAAVMGIWSSTSTSAGSAMQRERWHGTLELLVAAPSPFSLVMLPMTIAMSILGLYSMAATLLWGRVLFGIHVHVEHWAAFCLSVVVAVVSIGLVGFLMAVAFVRYRASWALGNLFEYPVWLICGFLVAFPPLPDWVEKIAWVLPPYWGMNAIRQSAEGGTPLPDAAMCAALGLVYLAFGILVSDYMLAAARRRATLALT
jgi:ABC-2 type transport system permease protein